ncbi:MAG: tRNA (uridine(34)/cytosine(34)/5-carboxymethylaminomethyluridine(34)-2'-O)-methyltransferase TrmL, partial [Oscillospiraceae bacterium]|nr:tRNA (uridine(34)/cytosine(34)/5-carboxymethylaminomethyluridine(34)-2'-O)-methyltransferase TrmL [Oscillospiraceae bacterium]
ALHYAEHPEFVEIMAIIVALDAFQAILFARLRYDLSGEPWILFGKETAGLPLWLRERYRDRCVRLPMREDARSLNLSNTAAVMCYEALRQQGFPGLSGTGEMAAK